MSKKVLPNFLANFLPNIFGKKVFKTAAEKKAERCFKNIGCTPPTTNSQEDNSQAPFNLSLNSLGTSSSDHYEDCISVSCKDKKDATTICLDNEVINSDVLERLKSTLNQKGTKIVKIEFKNLTFDKSIIELLNELGRNNCVLENLKILIIDGLTIKGETTESKGKIITALLIMILNMKNIEVLDFSGVVLDSKFYLIKPFFGEPTFATGDEYTNTVCYIFHSILLNLKHLQYFNFTNNTIDSKEYSKIFEGRRFPYYPLLEKYGKKNTSSILRYEDELSTGIESGKYVINITKLPPVDKSLAPVDKSLDRTIKINASNNKDLQDKLLKNMNNEDVLEKLKDILCSLKGGWKKIPKTNLKAKHKPLKANPKPVKAKPKTLKANPKPLKANPKPVKANHKPVKAKPKPVKANPKPVKANPKPLKANPKSKTK